jgi:hypothetical protein
LKLLCHKLVEFPKVDEGALPKLRTMQINSNSLQTLPLSLELLTNLRNLTIYNGIDKLENSCRENWQQSTIWRKWNMKINDHSTKNNSDTTLKIRTDYRLTSYTNLTWEERWAEKGFSKDDLLAALNKAISKQREANMDLSTLRIDLGI